jgi:hypothetical protein
MPHYQPEPGQTGIVVDASYFPWTFPHVYVLALTGPKILINGQEVPDTHWGSTHIPVPPGQYHVQLCTRRSRTAMWLGIARIGRDFGSADAIVPVTAGHSTRTYYRAPVVLTMNGALAPQQSKSPGMTWFLIVWSVVVVLILIAVVAIVVD